jgi:hypothetical protein
VEITSVSGQVLWAISDQFRDQGGPTCLMAGTKASTIVSVEIFIEQQVITPMRVGLEYRFLSKDGSTLSAFV